VSNRSGHAEIWALDTQTQKYRQLTGSASRAARRIQAVWSPDGTRLAVLEAYSYQDYAIAIYPVTE
jgi:Tol biopolymer transport system component